MVGTRVAPDNNDLVVWKLDDAAAPFVNSSTSPSAPSHAISDLATLNGAPLLRQPSLFAATGTNSCVLFTGNQSGTRNYIAGANNFLPQPPMTVSMWYYLRSYDTSGATQHGLVKQTTTGVWSGSTFSSINVAQNERYNGSGLANTSRFDFSIITNSSNAGGNAIAAVELTIPLNTWCHVGLTYDGTTVLSYINGNNVGSAVASPTGNVYYSGTPGPWFVGAIPSGSGSPEEPDASYCDVRIANIVRPQSYFSNIYNSGTLNTGQISVINTFYRMRAYDLYYTTTPLYWTDTSISYSNAPASPSGWGLGPIEILDSWKALNV
jgi:hypothetical protein